MKSRRRIWGNSCRLPAQITIYAALSLILVLSLVCTCIQSAYISLYKADADMASRLSVESVFAGYSNKMLEEFDILGLKNGDSLEIKLGQYADVNFKGNSRNTQFVSAQFEEKVFMTDHDGIGLEKQILEYMNYGIYSELMQKITGLEQQNKKSQIYQSVTEEIKSCEQKIFEIDRIFLDLVELVEGIQTDDAGIVVKNGKPISTGQHFAKEVLCRTVSMEHTEIMSSEVYGVLTGNDSKYVNAVEIIVEMMDDVDVLSELGNEESENDGANSCAELYRRNFERLSLAVSESIVKSKQAMEKIKEYVQKKQICSKLIDQCVDKVEQNRQMLGESWCENVFLDLQDMKGGETQNGKYQLCRIDEIEKGLIQNLSVLEKAADFLQSLNVTLQQNICDVIKLQLQQLKEVVSELSHEQLKFDYSMVDFQNKSTGVSAWKDLYKTLTQGISGLVLSDACVSECTVEYVDLASQKITQTEMNEQETQSDNSLASQMKNKVMYDEYLFERFNCYLDASEEKEKKERWCALEYPLEYIISGHLNDRENINDIIMKISLIREGLNLAYLITDATKRNEALSLASVLVGFTGNTAVIKAAQYLIMGVWAYGESICDLRLLFNGKTVPLIKNRENWHLSLEKLIALNFDLPDDPNKDSDTKGIGELDYKDYLRGLLLVQDQVKKRYRTMDVIELRMMALGEENFRMKDYIWSARGVISAKIEKSRELYIKEVQFQYA